jgi:hypothetical protein
MTETPHEPQGEAVSHQPPDVATTHPPPGAATAPIPPVRDGAAAARATAPVQATGDGAAAAGGGFGLPVAIALVMGSVIGVGIFNLPTSLAAIGPITLVSASGHAWPANRTARPRQHAPHLVPAGSRAALALM